MTYERACLHTLVSSMLALCAASCGTVLDIGGADGGRDACVMKGCPTGEEWDSLTCSCVIPQPTCHPPPSCAPGEIFDSVQCQCVANPTRGGDASAVDAKTTHDAAIAHDAAGTQETSVNRCGDVGARCCVLDPSGCSISNTVANGDPCSGFSCSDGSTPSYENCPPDCIPDAGASAACAPGTCRISSTSTGPCLPPGGPIGNVTPDGGPALDGCCGCGADGVCSAVCICASPDTPIATPRGDRAIASLAVGDIVYSIDKGEKVAVPVRQTQRNPVSNHKVIEVILRDGATLRISAAHPTADGRLFGDLHAGDWLSGAEVMSAGPVPYAFDATYDILPDSDTGTYFAGGALVGSTLAKTRPRTEPNVRACVLPPLRGTR